MDFQSIFNGSAMDPAGYSRILVNQRVLSEYRGKLRNPREPSGIKETALPVSMYSQVHAETRFDCYLQYFRRVQPNKGDTCLERLFGGPLASLGGLGEVLWASFGVPWDSLGVPWGTFECPLGCLGTPFGRSWVYFGGPLGSLGRP